MDSSRQSGLCRRSLIVSACCLLSACYGYGDLGTCSSPCQEKGYQRDAFCVCREKSTDTVLLPPNDYAPVAGRDIYSAPTPHCFLNNIVYLYNVSNRDVIATYSYLKNGTRERDTRRVPHGFRGYEDAKKRNTVLGYDMLDDQNCTAVDYQLERSMPALMTELEEQQHALQDILVKSKSDLLERLKNSDLLKPADSIISPASRDLVAPDHLVIVKKVELLDCSKECNGPTPSLMCLKGTPPDQVQVKAIRDQLQKPLVSDKLLISDVQAVIGKAVGCKREDVKLTATGALSNGEPCAYPFYFKEKDSEPSIVVHYPATVSANRVNQHNLSALEFKAPAETPVLYFRNKAINEDWGGKVVRISSDDNGVYYQTTGGCIALEIK